VGYPTGLSGQIVNSSGVGIPSAESVPFTPTGDIAAINVQAAIAEVDSEKVTLAQATSAAAAMAIALS
jgi:hypothetical protein